ncbi:MAG: amino acid permease [Desulfosporosinus sp. BRH_c37]|nr:MAG: amino acid permease [Desulfosporosinus sp. BRH_c37]
MQETDDKFERVLARKDVLSLAFGAMIGWGWVVLAGGWVKTAGSLGASLAFLIGSIVVIFIGLTYAELVAAMPLVGGEHVYSYRALGLTAAFICTWTIILGYVSVVAFEAVALPTVIEYLAPNYVQGFLWNVAGWDVYATWVLVGVIGSIVITIVNYVGIKTTAVLQNVLTGLVVIVGIMFITGSLFNGSTVNMQPFFVDGTKGIFGVLIAVPFMFVGFDVIPQAAAEINMPYKAIGKVLIVSVFMAAAWYILIVLGVSRGLDAQAMSTTKLATADAMGAVFHTPWASKLMILAGIGGIITSWNAFFVGGSRAIYAMADARMLPGFLAKLHPKYKTPTNAILLIGIISIIAPFFGRKTLVWLVDAGGFGIIIAYSMVALSFLVLRKKEPNMVRPFKVKHGTLVGYLAVILSLALALLYLPFSPSALVWPYEWGIFLIWMALGIVFYVYARMKYGKATSDRIMQHEFSKLDIPK